jgi:hypothetical protein
MNDLKVILDMVNNYFADFPFLYTILVGIFKPFIQLIQMIWHWKAID